MPDLNQTVLQPAALLPLDQMTTGFTGERGKACHHHPGVAARREQQLVMEAVVPIKTPQIPTTTTLLISQLYLTLQTQWLCCRLLCKGDLVSLVSQTTTIPSSPAVASRYCLFGLKSRDLMFPCKFKIFMVVVGGST